MNIMRYVIWLAAVIGLIVVLVLLLFHGGGKPKTVIQPLSSYSTTDASASMTVDGPVNSNQKHESYKITVDRTDVTFQQMTGYDGQVVTLQSYPNTESAYYVFLRAITGGGFTKGNKDPKLSDERGYCPLGDRYIFEFSEYGNDLERYWTSTCGGTKTFNGNAGLVSTLFQNQVPDYGKLSENLSL
jgi:hypothetical protein